MAITYLEVPRQDIVTIKVKLDGKHTGTIKRTLRGWEYFPKGKRTGGKPFISLALCQQSLEPLTCILTGTDGENSDDCTTHDHEEVESDTPDDPHGYTSDLEPTYFLQDGKLVSSDKPDYSQTYWNNKGKHKNLQTALAELIPAAGEVKDADQNPALEKFRIASNCYYDLYNNGLCNRAKEFRKVYGFSAMKMMSRNARGLGYDLTQEVIDRTESKMDEIILAAYVEQFPKTTKSPQTRLLSS